MHDITNFHQITETVGTAGQPSVEQLHEINQAGYSSVVNLAMADSDHALPEEGSIVASLGMTYIHIPVPFDAPSLAHLKQFFAVMDAMAGQKIFVHCVVNARVSVFMHQYLTLKKGLSSDQASTPLLKQWLPTMDSSWQSIMAISQDDLR